MVVYLVRIITGAAKGKLLRVPPRDLTRPMTSRARQGLFSALGGVSGMRVVDLFAGSGSLGLEALSRGAVSATFVESSPDAVIILDANIRSLGLGGTVHEGAALQFLAASEETFDLAFVDPPYSESLASVEEVMSILEPRLAPDATVVVRRRAGGEAPKTPPTLRLLARRRYGDDELFRYIKEGG